jgi:hypothetical protein
MGDPPLTPYALVTIHPHIFSEGLSTPLRAHEKSMLILAVKRWGMQRLGVPKLKIIAFHAYHPF